jgi:hypothetical protein
MSDLDRILKLAGQAPQSPAPAEEVATEREMKPVAHEAVGEFADPILDLCDELGCDSDHPVLDELIRYLDGDTIKDFVADFRRHNDMNGDMEEAQQLNASDYTCEDCGDTMHAPTTDCGHDCNDETGSWWKDENGNGVPDSLEEAKAKPDFLDVDKDGDKDEPMKKAIKDKKVDEAEEADTDTEELEEAQSQAQKDAFAKMLASKKGGKKDDEVDESEETTEEKVEETTVEENLEKAQEEIDELKELDESPTMDTTQLINLMKNSGLSEEAIQSKLNEWANTPEGAAEEEATSHGDAYDWAQNVNLSLKRYLDAEDMKVGLKEHTVEDLKESYKAKKAQ